MGSAGRGGGHSAVDRSEGLRGLIDWAGVPVGRGSSAGADANSNAELSMASLGVPWSERGYQCPSEHTAHGEVASESFLGTEPSF